MPLLWRRRKQAVNPKHLPPNTAIGDGYIVGRALNQTEDAIIYAALDQTTQERIRIYEYFPRQLARRDARTLEVAPVPGSEQAFADGMEALRARMEALGCKLYEAMAAYTPQLTSNRLPHCAVDPLPMSAVAMPMEPMAMRPMRPTMSSPSSRLTSPMRPNSRMSSSTRMRLRAVATASLWVR